MSEAAYISVPSAASVLNAGSELVPATPAAVVPFAHGRYAIPTEDLPDYRALSQKERDRVDVLLTIFQRLETDPSGIVRASETLAFHFRHVRGLSATNIQRLYYEWRDRGWRALPRGYNNGKSPLPAEFVQHIRALMEQNARSMKQAINLLKRQWMSGKEVPGYGTWRDWYFAQWPDREIPSICPGYPEGWSKSNLYAIQPKKAARALATRGFAAAKAHLPSMLRDTSKLLPLQLITIDDFECDHLCFFVDATSGQRYLAKVTGVAAMDVSTRRILGLILKPRAPDAKGKEQAITRAEVRLLLFQLLRDYGVPEHGMTILAERAAAAVTAELEATFTNLFGGRIAVRRTSMIDAKVLANGFLERGGKPWLKGWIESAFNLLANIAAPLPGYKGPRYQLKPADLGEKMRITERLIGTGPQDAQLSTNVLEQARTTFLRPAELIDAYMTIFDLMELRTEHEMRGFDEVALYRRHASESFRPIDAEFAALSQDEQLACETAFRMESPRERWAKLWPRVRTQKVDAAALMMLCLTPKRATWKRQRLTIAHGRQGYTFAQHGSALTDLPEGTEVLVYFDATNCTGAHVCHMDGRYIGDVRRLGPVDITDRAAVSDAEQQLAEIYNGIRAEVRARPLHQATDAQLVADAQANAQLVAQHGKSLTAALGRELPAPADQPETLVGQHAAAQIAAAADTAHAKRLEAAARRRAVSTQAAGNGLASLVPEAGSDPEDDAAAPSLADLID